MKSVTKLNNCDGELFFLYQLVDESYLRDAIAYTSRLASGRKYTLIISSNEKFEQVNKNQVYIVFSDNTYREFSGWNLCIDAIQQRIKENSVLVFLNQTCNLYRENSLRDKLRRDAINKAFSINYPAVYGEVHASQYQGDLPPTIAREYINTAFFIISKPQTSLKNIFISEVSYDQEIYKFSFLKADAHKGYLDYVISIVTGEHPKIKWHNYRKYKGNPTEQRKKVMTVLLEHRLSKKLIESGYAIHNILPSHLLPSIYLKLVDRLKILYKMKRFY